MRVNEKRLKLWLENPNCCWCGRLTQIREDDHAFVREDTATVEHMISRLDGFDRWLAPEKQKKAISCPACNNLRQIEEQRAFDIVRGRTQGLKASHVTIIIVWAVVAFKTGKNVSD